MSKRLIECIKKELKRSATSTMDAILLNMLKQSLKYKEFDNSAVDYVRKKYNIKSTI